MPRAKPRALRGAICAYCDLKANQWCGDEPMCPKHAGRWRRHGDPTTAKKDMSLRGPVGAEPAERVAVKLATTATGMDFIWTCWEYRGVLQRGYGRMVGSKGQGVVGETLVHRIVYRLVHGEIPEGLTLDHLCRNRACCNPFHLEPVTAQVNSERGFSPYAVNARKTHCDKGHLLEGDNLRLEEGRRRCRQCHREASSRHKAKKRAELTGDAGAAGSPR